MHCAACWYFIIDLEDRCQLPSHLFSTQRFSQKLHTYKSLLNSTVITYKTNKNGHCLSYSSGSIENHQNFNLLSNFLHFLLMNKWDQVTKGPMSCVKNVVIGNGRTSSLWITKHTSVIWPWIWYVFVLASGFVHLNCRLELFIQQQETWVRAYTFS